MNQLLCSFACIFLSLTANAQNVGIGTTAPVSKLHVKGTGSGTQIVLEENTGSMLRLSNENTGAGPYLGTTTNHPLSLVSNNTVRLTVAAGGNIGIGQSSPAVPLNFASTLGNKISLWGNSSNHFGFGIQPALMQLYTADATNDIAFGFGNSTAFTENMRIRGNGNLGIGTTSPEQMLSVSGGAVIDQDNNNTGTSAAMLRFGGSSGEGIGSKRTAGTNQYGLDLYTNNTQRMTIANNGNIGVRTNTPQAALDVNGDVNIANMLLMNNTAGNAGQVLMSNGSGAAPTWQNAAYNNLDRFAFRTIFNDPVSTGNFGDTIAYSIFYSLSSAITYNAGVFTANKSGLYSFDAVFTAIAHTSNSNTLPQAVIYMFVKFPSTSFNLTVLDAFTVDLQGQIGSGDYNNLGTGKQNFQHWLLAGTQFYFYGTIQSNNLLPPRGIGNATMLNINLVSE